MIFLLVLLSLIASLVWFIKKDNDDLVIVCFFLTIFWCVPPIISYNVHANDLGTIRGQYHIIKVYEQRIVTLQNILNNAKERTTSLMNADAPTTTITINLSEAVTELANAKYTKAEALRSIERRKASMFKFIVIWFGDK